MRVAHFVSQVGIIDNPSNTALINSLLDIGYEVDVYAPDEGPSRLMIAESAISIFPVSYGLKWIATHSLSAWWFRYSLFSATSEDPISAACILARLYRKKLIVLADEIKSGSYAGNRSKLWKSLCVNGLQRASLVVVNEKKRKKVFLEYVDNSFRGEVVVMPNCYVDPPLLGSRQAIRKSLGIPESAFVACYSGVFNLGNGALWFARSVAFIKDVWFWAQVVVIDNDMAKQLLPLLQGNERLTIQDGSLGWRYPWTSMAAADLGFVFYLNDAPQFRAMGLASNRLCMFLSSGVPVVASRQKSFEFLEVYGCGILVDSWDQIPGAITAIRNNHESMKMNALRCAREYIDVRLHFQRLRKRILEVLN